MSTGQEHEVTEELLEKAKSTECQELADVHAPPRRRKAKSTSSPEAPEDAQNLECDGQSSPMFTDRQITLESRPLLENEKLADHGSSSPPSDLARPYDAQQTLIESTSVDTPILVQPISANNNKLVIPADDDQWPREPTPVHVQTVGSGGGYYTSVENRGGPNLCAEIVCACLICTCQCICQSVCYGICAIIFNTCSGRNCCGLSHHSSVTLPSAGSCPRQHRRRLPFWSRDLIGLAADVLDLHLRVSAIVSTVEARAVHGVWGHLGFRSVVTDEAMVVLKAW